MGLLLLWVERPNPATSEGVPGRRQSARNHESSRGPGVGLGIVMLVLLRLLRLLGLLALHLVLRLAVLAFGVLLPRLGLGLLLGHEGHEMLHPIAQLAEVAHQGVELLLELLGFEEHAARRRRVGID